MELAQRRARAYRAAKREAYSEAYSWQMADGVTVPFTHLTDLHLLNIRNFLRRRIMFFEQRLDAVKREMQRRKLRELY